MSYPKSEEFLAHYGIKGMKWGFRKRSNGTVEKTGRTAKTATTTKAPEHTQAQQLKKKKASELSNKELRELNERIQLEQNYARLTAEPSRVQKGMAYMDKTMKVAKTGQELYNLVNSPAGKAARSIIEAQIKKS